MALELEESTVAEITGETYNTTPATAAAGVVSTLFLRKELRFWSLTLGRRGRMPP